MFGNGVVTHRVTVTVTLDITLDTDGGQRRTRNHVHR